MRAGGFVFVGGQVGRDVELQQFVQAFENVKMVLGEAGASFDDVVEMVKYRTDMRDLELFMKVKDHYYTGRYPTWTGVGVTALEVEIKVTACLGNL